MVKIVVRYDPDRDQYLASILDQPERCDSGPTPNAAVGNLIGSCPGEFGIDVSGMIEARQARSEYWRARQGHAP
jgi:hypothetical protein